MNGETVAKLGTKLPGLGAPMVVPEVVALLEQALAEARAGSVKAVLVVRAHGPGTVQCAAAGNLLMELFFGASQIQDALKQAASGRPSSILMPR